MSVRIRTHGKNKRVTHVGDLVKIRRMPGEVPRSRVDALVPPVVSSVRRGSKSKLVTVKYVDTEDGRPHYLELPATALRCTASELSIGDHVTLHQRDKGVVVSVGSEGRVLGGSGGLYTVTFQMTTDPVDGTDLARPITVTQNDVPRHTLAFVGASDSDDSYSSDSDVDDVPDEEALPPRIHADASLLTLRHYLSSDVRDELLQLLSLDELDALAVRLTPAIDGTSVSAVLRLLHPARNA